jgi:hypothetical protein
MNLWKKATRLSMASLLRALPHSIFHVHVQHAVQLLDTWNTRRHASR